MAKYFSLIVIFILVSSCSGLSTPTNTSTPIRETVQVEVTRLVTLEVTRVVTNQVMITQTPVPTATPTPLPATIYEEYFDTDSGDWMTGEYDYGVSVIEDGELFAELKEPNYYWDITTLTGTVPSSNYEILFDLRHVSGEGDSSAGFKYYYYDEKNYVSLLISRSNQVSFGLLVDDYWTSLIPWQKSKFVDYKGTKIHIIQKSGRIQIFANEGLLFDSIYLEPGFNGSIGFEVNTTEKPAEWAFDNLIIRDLNP